ncbi:unnamed protein product [Protopolystoma xenopodis]|uniref:Secreted protein n=1 Tax=Protopolystoma xenopodis TaxID=117903 RepID=A0A448WM84_9PLAT|nr:unnamed protein product [Protopolystoma xenopodis]
MSGWVLVCTSACARSHVCALCTVCISLGCTGGVAKLAKCRAILALFSKGLLSLPVALATEVSRPTPQLYHGSLFTCYMVLSLIASSGMPLVSRLPRSASSPRDSELAVSTGWRPASVDTLSAPPPLSLTTLSHSFLSDHILCLGQSTTGTGSVALCLSRSLSLCLARSAFPPAGRLHNRGGKTRSWRLRGEMASGLEGSDL